jgi:hypothetical protein
MRTCREAPRPFHWTNGRPSTDTRDVVVEANLLLVREARDLAVECVARSSMLSSEADTEEDFELMNLATECVTALSRIINRIGREKGAQTTMADMTTIGAVRVPYRSRVDRLEEIALIRSRLAELAELLAHRVADLSPLLADAHAALERVAVWIQAHPAYREVRYIDRRLS